MSVTSDFRDLLFLFEKHQVRYLVIGGYAFAFHARPRYTKDLDLFVETTADNIAHANEALEEFGSPFLLALDKPGEILQLGVEPNRIDLIQQVGKIDFSAAWNGRVRAMYGDVEVSWIGLDALIESKQVADRPRDREDIEILKDLLRRRQA